MHTEWQRKAEENIWEKEGQRTVRLGKRCTVALGL